MKELEEYPVIAYVTEEEKHKYMKKKWRAFEAIGKLHNEINYIQRSPQHHETYSIIRDKLQKEAYKKLKVPTMDDNTYWRSIMDMVDYTLEN